jgi:hypothetical protein
MRLTRRQFEVVVLAAVVVTAGTGVSLVDRRPGATTTFAGGTPPGAGAGGELTRPSVPAGIRAVHAGNATGAGATVGVVAVTGIDTSHPALAARITDARSFGEAPPRPTRARHGTAAALTVAAVAPDADLLVATAHTPSDARRAIAWLTTRGADVVLVPATELGAPGDGTGVLARAAARAADRGSLVVAPTGNLARNHWQGRLDPTPRGLHSFDGTVRMPLLPPPGTGTRAGGVVQARLQWNRSAYPRDLTLELYRAGPTGPVRVAASEPVRTGSVRIERLDARVRPGDLFLAVRLPNQTVRRFDPLPARVELTTRRHRLAAATAPGSIASPATAPPVLSVGAAAPNGPDVAPYSSRGPTADGRRGVDVVAPPTVWPGSREGTSAAAAHAAGVAALVAAEGDGPSPDRVAAALCDAAADVPPAGPDPGSGHGRIDAAAAVTAIDKGTESTRDTDRTPPRTTDHACSTT